MCLHIFNIILRKTYKELENLAATKLWWSD